MPTTETQDKTEDEPAKTEDVQVAEDVQASPSSQLAAEVEQKSCTSQV
jgi:hypothetical protein